MYTDHSALHCLLTINSPSGSIIQWRLRLAELDFEIKYKKGRINSQADDLSKFRTSRETTPHVENYDVPVLLELESDGYAEERDFVNVWYAEIDELLTTK